MTALVIVGAGRHGREVEAYLRDIPEQVALLGYLDERKAVGTHEGARVLGGFAVVPALREEHGTVAYITATGDNRARAHLATAADAAGLMPWSLVHPGAHLGPGCVVGPGCCLAPGTVLTRDVRVGLHCIINTGVTISHDCRIGDHVNLNPGVTVCGDVVLGRGCYVGAGATVIDKVEIGAGTVVGAGAVVVDHLPPGVLAMGVPARVTRVLAAEADHAP